MNRLLLCVLAFSTVPALAQQLPAPRTAAPSKVETPAEEYPLDLKKLDLTLPNTNDRELTRLFTSRNTVFYKLPPVWQHYVPSSRIEQNNLTLGTKSFYSTQPIWAIYYATYNPDFHANFNFPWETTVGLNVSHKTTKDTKAPNPYATINFVNLPEVSGVVQPILIINEYPIKWIYPVGTTFGEIIYVTHNGKKYTQEVRTRTKDLDSKFWTPGMYRPITSRAEFEQATGLKNYVAFKKFYHFRNPQENEVFLMSGLVERLPNLNEDIIRDLLARPFKPVDVDQDVWTPAADQDFHIMPKDYCLALLGGVDTVTCSSCHRQTQISVRNLTPSDPDVVKTPLKIGNIRGCDGIFTWHPFAAKCIRSSDKDPVVNPALRPHDLKYGFVTVAEDKDYGSAYKLTEYVQEALKPYELPPAKFLHEKDR